MSKDFTRNLLCLSGRGGIPGSSKQESSSAHIDPEPTQEAEQICKESLNTTSHVCGKGGTVMRPASTCAQHTFAELGSQ